MINIIAPNMYGPKMITQIIASDSRKYFNVSFVSLFIKIFLF